MDDLEENRKQKLLDIRRLRFTCGWTSEELGWQQDERRLKGGWNTETGLRNWLADRYRKESSIQSLAEGSIQRYLRELNLTADLTPNIDGWLYPGDAVQVKGSGGLMLAALPSDVDEGGEYLHPCRVTATADTRALRRTTFRVLRNDARLSSSVPFLYEECILLSIPRITGGDKRSSEKKNYRCLRGCSETKKYHRWFKNGNRNLKEATRKAQAQKLDDDILDSDPRQEI
ncbi:hypothetical protein NPIL_104981 [Nephila pilipes]|uniref:Uncharacterized protein n=1 Tax=Nephila pilipes TaxID=299642 RepID=A0A8X6N5Q5_NEPPI|nr:hypothetical protein NPIL_104981 [Nephila pilipes]